MIARLLVVDDETEIREMLSRHFRFLGYEVDVAGDGVEALEMVQSRPYAVVISDVVMPKMNGVDLLSRIRGEYPMTHVIMITGYVNQENLLACMRLGADDCILKPIQDLGELEKAVEKAVSSIQRWTHILTEILGMKPRDLEGGR